MKIFSQPKEVKAARLKSVARYISPSFPYGQIFGVREDGAVFERTDSWDPDSRRKSTTGWRLVTNRDTLSELEGLPDQAFKGSGHPMTKDITSLLRLPQSTSLYLIPNWV